jgi:outer membrane protein assembly factor BamB
MRGKNLNLERKRNIGRAALLAVLIIAAVIVASGCIRGITPVGWSGGVVSDNTIYIGSEEGRLVALNLDDDSRKWAEPLKAAAQAGLFGCSPATAGCGTAAAGVAIYGTPVVSGELVYIAGYNGKIYAYAVDTLATRWVYPREGYLQPFVGGLAIGDGRLYAGCSDGKVYALDAITGDKLWEYATGDKIWSTPVYQGKTIYSFSTNTTVIRNRVFIGSYDKKFYALNADDGTKQWEFSTESAIIATPLLFNDTLYIGCMDRNLYAVRAADGVPKWKFTGENWFWAKPAVWNGMVYAGCLDDKVYVLNADTGGYIATLDLGSPVASSPVVMGNLVIFATRKGVIYSIDSVSNQARQLADIELDVNGPLTAYNDVVYIHTQDLSLHRINAVSGAVLPSLSLGSQD